MPDVIKRGSLLPHLQDVSYDFDPSRGFTVRKNFRGASQAWMANLLQECVNAGVAARLTFHQGDTATLESEDSTEQYTLDTWQLLGNAVQFELFYHPEFTATVEKYFGTNVDAAAQAIGKLREQIQKLEEGQGTIAELWSAPIFTSAGVSSEDKQFIARLILLYLRGTESFDNDAYGGGYVLRHTTNAPNRWAANVADLNVGKIYTTAQLLSEVQNSSDWVFPMPGRLAYKLANIPAPTAHNNHLWGWKKSRSTECNAANNRIDISTEYTLEQWSTDLYPPI